MPKTLRLATIASKVLLPWVILLLMAISLGGYRYHQLEVNRALDAHNAKHRESVMLANDLLVLSLERWTNALRYRIYHDPNALERLNQSEATTLEKMDKIEHLFGGSENALHAVSDSGETILDSYRVARQGMVELYRQFIHAVDTGDTPRQNSLQGLLTLKIRQVRAALDDLVTYQIKTATLAETRRREIQTRGEWIFFSLLAALILAGMIFSRYQTLSIARPLGHLTLLAKQIGQGSSVDLGGFTGPDEIGELAQALDQMVNALRRSHAELEAQKSQLVAAYAEVEARVQQRTAELSRRTAALETANHDLENFSYSVSHDLRAPLRAIDGFIAMLLDEHAEQLDAEGRRMFGVVSDNARKMGRLIDDILAFSRAGRLELDPIPVDMQAMVKEVWAALLESAPDRTIELKLDDLPASRCDPRALRQVWQNLLANAIKFTRDRNPAIIHVAATDEGEFIRYTVADNGVGFNADYAGKLFVLFQRLHGMDEFEGTGVGLAIVKRLIQKHGGQILASGILDQGATFSFTLPKQQAIPET